MAIKRIMCLVAALVLGLSTAAGAQTVTTQQYGDGATALPPSEEQAPPVSEEQQSDNVLATEDPPAPGGQPPAEDGPERKFEVEKLPSGQEVVPGEIVVNYKDKASKDKASKTLKEKVKAKQVAVVPATNAEGLAFDELESKKGEELKKGLDAKIAEVEKDPAVQDAHYNYIYRLAWTPNDDLFQDGTQTEIRKVRGPSSWDLGKGNTVKIGIIDSGYNDQHIDFNATVGSTEKVVAQYDFVHGDNHAFDGGNGVAAGHGSGTASIASAKTNNAAGIAGACPNCDLIIAKAFDSDGAANSLTIANGMNFAVDNGAKALNLSFVIYGYGNGAPTSLVNAVNYCLSRNCQPVAAAGNDGIIADPSGPRGAAYPANIDGVIAVAALNDDGTSKASFSNYGSYVDVAAPGVTIPMVNNYTPGGASYKINTGTSFSAPFVTGLSGMLYGHGLTDPGDRSYWIKQGAIDIGTLGEDNKFGHGRLDMYNSMASVVAPN